MAYKIGNVRGINKINYFMEKEPELKYCNSCKFWCKFTHCVGAERILLWNNTFHYIRYVSWIPTAYQQSLHIEQVILCKTCLFSFASVLAEYSKIDSTQLKLQGPVVRRPISTNPGLNFNLGFFFFCSKAFSRIIFSILFRASNHQIVGKKNKTEFAF